MMNLMKKLVREEKGQGMTEYALILGVVVAIIVGIVATGLDDAIKEKFTAVTNQIKATQ